MKKRHFSKKSYDESIKAFVGVVLIGLIVASLYVVYYFINNGGIEIIDALLEN